MTLIKGSYCAYCNVRKALQLPALGSFIDDAYVMLIV